MDLYQLVHLYFMSYVYFMRLFLQKFFTANLLLSIFLFVSLFSGEMAFGASSSASIDYEKARASYHSLFQSKKRMYRRDQWISVIQKFDLIYARDDKPKQRIREKLRNF